MNISNVGAKIAYSETMAKDFIPANLRLGGSYTVQVDQYNAFTGMLDFNKMLVPTPWRVIDNDTFGKNPDVGVIQGIFQSFYDAPGGWQEEMHEINISLGFEYLYNKVFAFRGGYFHESGHRLYGKGGRQYFTLGDSPLKNTLRFTLKFNFAEYMRKQAENY